ncbi:MAG: DUF3108 domain-containing protein [Magnetococcales bacterium]|nr:DUF3108 domain-containing protein [Magnetococcales bacterium]
MKQFVILVSMLCALLPLQRLTAGESGWRLGAVPGEQLTYRISWLGVPSADASLHWERGTDRHYTLQATLSTIGAARLLRALDETLKSEGERHDSTFAAHRSVKDQHRGDQVKWTSFWFDREMRQVERRHRSQQGKAEERVIIPVESDQVTDPLSALYAVRAWPELLSGRTLQRVVVDGEKSFCLTIHIGGSQQWQNGLGSFRAFPLQVAVENSELFRQRGPIHLLLSDDARRIPLQIEAQLAIGAVVAELVGFDDGRGESRKLAE